MRQLPHPVYPFTVLAVIEAATGRPPTAAESDLYEALWDRRTNRGPFCDERVPESVLALLQQAADQQNCSLRMLDSRDTARVLTLAEDVGQQLSDDHAHMAELRQWIATGQPDGIPVDALPMRSTGNPSPVRDADYLAAAPAERPRAVYEAYPQLAILTTHNDEPEDWLQAGQALQHVLLVATACGLSATFFYHLAEKDDMHEEESQMWPWPENRQMVIRLGYGSPTVPVPRRPLAEIITSMGELRMA